MGLDERASDVAWTAWKGCAELTYRERLDVAITAYEQARERVAVPSRAELHDVITDHYDQDDYVAARLADALFVFLSKSPAPSAQPWTRELAAKLYRESRLSNAECTPRDLFEAGLREFQSELTPLVRPVLREIKLGLTDIQSTFDPNARLNKIGFVQDLVNQAIILCREQKSGPEWKECVESQLRTALASVEEEHALRVAAERDLVAERAAHEAEVSRLKQELVNAETRMVDAREDAAGAEKECSSLREQLGEERERVNRCRDEHELWKREDHTERDRLKQELSECKETQRKFGTLQNELIGRAVTAERERDTAVRHEANLREALKAERAINADQFARIGELKREVAERESDARLHYASWVTAVNTIYATNVALGKPAPDTTDNPVQLATELQAELAACKLERDEARAKLEALREWADRAIRVDTSEGYVFAARDVANLIDPHPGELLLAESPKPATFGERIEHFARESVRTPENGAVTSRAAEPKRFTHEQGCMQPDNHDCACPSPAAEFKPGDVLSGEAAKAYMLANPGRRVAHAVVGSEIFMGCHSEIGQVQEGRVYIGANIFCDGHYRSEEFIVLPPEPAKPATPDLDLAGRVGRVEKALRILLEMNGIVLDGAAYALKALEGGGSNG